MKNRTINTEFIWNKWAVEKLSFAQIANLDIPRTVGMKRIKNIVYGGQSRCYTGWEKKLYKDFRLKFLELQDVQAAIEWVAENQPTVRISRITVRRVITYRIKKNAKSIKSTNYES